MRPRRASTSPPADCSCPARRCAGRGSPGRAARDRVLDAQAELEPVAVAPLLARLQPDFGWGGDLAVAGRIDVRSAPRFEAAVEIVRRAGDLSVTRGRQRARSRSASPTCASRSTRRTASGASPRPSPARRSARWRRRRPCAPTPQRLLARGRRADLGRARGARRQPRRLGRLGAGRLAPGRHAAREREHRRALRRAAVHRRGRRQRARRAQLPRRRRPARRRAGAQPAGRDGAHRASSQARAGDGRVALERRRGASARRRRRA